MLKVHSLIGTMQVKAFSLAQFLFFKPSVFSHRIHIVKRDTNVSIQYWCKSYRLEVFHYLLEAANSRSKTIDLFT